MSPDLRHARIWVSVLGSQEQKARTLEGLHSAAGYLRHEVCHRLRMRRVPEMEFHLDLGAEELDRIEVLLRDLKKESPGE